jgi:hypothetical protein
VPSPRSGRQRKAWGGAQRNPRNAQLKQYSKFAKRPTEEVLRAFCNRRSYRPLRGLNVCLFFFSWGFATLHPRLYAVGRAAGWGSRTLKNKKQFSVQTLAFPKRQTKRLNSELLELTRNCSKVGHSVGCSPPSMLLATDRKAWAISTVSTLLRRKRTSTVKSFLGDTYLKV